VETPALDVQSLIIKVYQYLQSQATKFIRCVKYAFENYVVEKGDFLNHNKLLKQLNARSENALTVDLSEDSNVQTLGLIQASKIKNTNFLVPSPSIPIDKDTAMFILKRIHKGDQLNPDVWLNDECINYYMNHVIAAIAKETNQNVKIIATYFFQRLYFDNRNLPGAPEMYFMDYREALPYWKEDGDIYIIPINVHNEHWSLVTVDIPNCTMAFHDSLGSYKGWDGTVFMDIIFQFMIIYCEIELDVTKWTFISSNEVYKWSKKFKRFAGVPQQNAFDCGLFILKYAELFVLHPKQRKSLNDILKTNLPDRSLYKKHFLGLYVEYRQKEAEKATIEKLSESDISPQKRKKRRTEESWGAEPTFKRAMNERDRSDITLRESTQRLSKVHVTTPIKAEKLSDTELDDSDEEAQFEQTKDEDSLTNKLEADVSEIDKDKSDSNHLFDSSDDDMPVIRSTMNAKRSDENLFDSSDEETVKISAQKSDTVENEPKAVSDDHLFDSSDDDMSTMNPDMNAKRSDENLFDSSVQISAKKSDTVENEPKAVSDDKADTKSNSSEDISEITNDTKQSVPKQSVTTSKAINPHVLAGIPHSYKHVVDPTVYNEANFNRLIDDYKIATKNLKVVFQFPLREMLFDPPKSLKTELLKLHYKHEDFRDYVYKQIEDELSKHRKLLKHSKFYTSFDGTKFIFDDLAKNIRKEFKEALGGNFPHDRDLKTYPKTKFTDVIRDMPAENTTIMETPPPHSDSSIKNTPDNNEEHNEDAYDGNMSMDIEHYTKPSPNPVAKELFSGKITEFTNMEDDELSYIGIQLANYKKSAWRLNKTRGYVSLLFLLMRPMRQWKQIIHTFVLKASPI